MNKVGRVLILPRSMLKIWLTEWSRQDSFTLDIMEMPQGAGSGIIWDKTGHLVTNYHVIKQASEVQVSFL